MSAVPAVLAIDAGTSRVRAAVVDAEARVRVERRRELPPRHPAPGRVEFDARALADAVLGLAREALAEAGPVAAVGITSQRASTVVWQRASGEPVAPAQGWQDLRTLRACAALRERGIRLAPNQSAAKLADILDGVDPERGRDLCFGTVDAWLAWVLSEGAVHVTDPSNASATGLLEAGERWSPELLAALRIPERMLPALADSSGLLAPATALPGTPYLAGLIGDQQASLLGLGCVEPGDTKITFGTSAMLDTLVGGAPAFAGDLGGHGTFPIVAWRLPATRGAYAAGAADGPEARTTFALEASELCAGGCVDWLRDLGILESAESSHAVASACEDAGGVVFVPALLGLGTPFWDYHARGTFLGLTRGTGRPELVRAVLEGVAARAADLVEAVEADAGLAIPMLRVDGGMTGNPSFVQALADATGRRIEVSSVREATLQGAAFLAGRAVGLWREAGELIAGRPPGPVVEPRRRADRERWREALARARGTRRPSC
jgi:glycerol kinase